MGPTKDDPLPFKDWPCPDDGRPVSPIRHAAAVATTCLMVFSFQEKKWGTPNCCYRFRLVTESYIPSGEEKELV
jgi:hypothetical protein